MSTGIEILSPAGGPEAFKIAVDSGADAVYFGGSRFSARKNAVNFTDEDIKEAVKYAHLRGVKLYAAVNTLMFDSELSGVFDFVKFLYESGVDAIIVQDLGVAGMIKKYFPDFKIHASTQMTIHNLAGAVTAKKAGFDRVVLSRELSFEEIKYISENCDIELEVFVHGALCMSYSGQCLLSGFLGGRSGNRGLCAQPCRHCYTLTDEHGNVVGEKDKYLLSLKDLSLIDYIDDLKKIGVKSFKIEGRMKSSAYVSAVTGIFNKYRDGSKVSDYDRKLLFNIFSRDGFTDGYFKASNGRGMLNYGKSNDDIYQKATDDVVASALEFAGREFSYPLKAVFTAKKGQLACLKAYFDDREFEVSGTDEVQQAQKRPVDRERIKQQLEKLGGTLFCYSELMLDVEDDIFISVGEVNALRREMTEKIENYIIGHSKTYTGEDFAMVTCRKSSADLPVNVASVLTHEQAEEAYRLGFDKIYVPYDLYKSNKMRYDSDADVFVVKLPPVNHDRFKPDFSDISTMGICITNIGQLEMIKGNYEIISDYRMNVTNSLSINELVKRGVSVIGLSAELTLSQIKELSHSHILESVIYGRTALMTVKNCVIKSALGKCGCSNESIYYLRDRKNISFPVIADKSSCTNVIYNSAPVFMADKMKDIKNSGINVYRYDFTVETPAQMREIVDMYENGIKSGEFFTRGHFYNGIL